MVLFSQSDTILSRTCFGDNLHYISRVSRYLGKDACAFTIKLCTYVGTAAASGCRHVTAVWHTFCFVEPHHAIKENPTANYSFNCDRNTFLMALARGAESLLFIYAATQTLK